MPEETKVVNKPTEKPAEENPTKGGSYIRNADGSLTQVEATKPAAPQLYTNPADAARKE